MNYKINYIVNFLLIKFLLKIFIELSDGWYPIKALCDTHLTILIKNERIKIGDKLSIFSCDIVAAPKDGCPPLEVNFDVRLRTLIFLK